MRRKVWYAPYKHESFGEAEIKAVEQSLRDGWLAGFGPKSTVVINPLSISINRFDLKNDNTLIKMIIFNLIYRLLPRAMQLMQFLIY